MHTYTIAVPTPHQPPVSYTTTSGVLTREDWARLALHALAHADIDAGLCEVVRREVQRALGAI